MKLMIVDTSGIRRLVDDLDVFAKKAVPYAIRNSLNRSAFEARRAWVDEIEKTMTLRNTFTIRSLRVEKVSTMDPRRMVSVVGSTAEYMGRRESGETKRPHGKHGVPVPTLAARGGSKARLIQKPNKMSNIVIARGRPGATKKQRNAIALRRAAAFGTRFVFLETGRGAGLFRVMGGKRKLEVRAIWDMSHKTVTVHPFPTLETTLRRIGPRVLDIHTNALVEQAQRYRVLGY